MSNKKMEDFAFNFKFKLHKSVIPIGIDDEDYDVLQKAYDVPMEMVMETVKADNLHLDKYAAKLAEEVDLSKIGDKPLRIEFLGDSITSDRRSYMNIIRRALKDKPNVEIVDFAISALKIADLFTALYVDYMIKPADIAHIMIGTNDYRSVDDELGLTNTSIGEYERDLDYIVRELTKAGTKVIISTIPPTDPDKSHLVYNECKATFKNTDRLIFNAIIDKVAQKYHATVNHMDEYYGQYSSAVITLEDGLHLNELGHELLVKQVAEHIVELAN